MRPRYSTIVLAIMLATGLGACQNELEDRYLNPDKTANASIEYLFTKMLNNNRVRPSYWDISTFVNWHIGVYTQSVGFLNSESMYQQNESYINDRWNDFYRPSDNSAGVMAHFREIEKAYAALPDQEKKTKEVFLHAAKIVLFDQTAQMVDLWGDIPFSEAGGLNSLGAIVYPKFDDASEIYDTMLFKLKETSAYFAAAAATPAPLTQTSFTTQDILLNGNLQKWQRYANALRLRLLMRISFVDEDRARQEVLAMLNAPADYPLPGDNTLYHPDTDDILLKPLTDYTDDLHNAFADWTNYTAPYFMVEEVLKPAGDPRLVVLFDKYGKIDNGLFTPNTTYAALPLEMTRIDQQKTLENYAIVDSSTFLYNPRIPGIVITAAEVNFLKAEAYERWGGGDARKAYQTAIKQSIDFYYYLNSLNSLLKAPLPPLTVTEKEAFVENTIAIQYQGTTEEKLARIGTQKWVHFGFLQSVQSWAELRRTGYPRLTFHSSSLSGYEQPPSRLTYPTTEKTFNRNYQAVTSKDIRDNKIFWDVKQ